VETASAYRRFLPHFRNPEKTYFITFCTRDRNVLAPNERTIVLREAVKHHRQMYYLVGSVVMPDHVHLVLMPLDAAIYEIVKQIKGASAREINRQRAASGALWQREYFDRQLREGEDARKKGEYVINNPVRARLVARTEDDPWLWRAWIEGGDEWR